MEGFVRLWKYEHHGDLCSFEWEEYRPIRDIQRIAKLTSLELLAKYLKIYLSKVGDSNESLPFYCVTFAEDMFYIAHPDERERMAALIAGELDPMRALVHELRYNPNVGLGVKPYQAHFYEGSGQLKKHKNGEGF